MRTILENYTILYVEDELDVQANMSEYLKSYFKEVYLAASGKEALLLYEKFSPDVLLLDINIPDIDGLSVAKEIRKKDRDVRILMLTAHTDEEKLLKALDLKLTKYLVKPVSPKDFKKTLDILVSELKELSSAVVILDDEHIWIREKKRLLKVEEEVKLTQKEIILLEFFIEHRGNCVSYAEIMAVVWQDEFFQEISIGSVKNLASNLRKKLPVNFITNVYGKGYMLG